MADGIVGQSFREAGGGTAEVDDPALASLGHAGKDGLCEIERGFDVDLKGDLAALGRVAAERRVDGRRRVVHQDVDGAAERLLRAGHDRRSRHGIREVGGDRDSEPATRPQLLQRGREASGKVIVLVDGARDDRDIGPFESKPFGDGRADAAGRSRDDGPATGHQTALR